MHLPLDIYIRPYTGGGVSKNFLKTCKKVLDTKDKKLYYLAIKISTYNRV